MKYDVLLQSIEALHRGTAICQSVIGELGDASAGIDHQLFVSRYLVALPKPEELRALIEANREAMESGDPWERWRWPRG